MAETLTLARPYALAAFEIAKENHRFDQWSRTLAQLAQVTSTAALRDYLASPVHSTQTKALTVIDLLGDGIEESTKRFIRVLAGNHRLSLIPDIRAIFEDLLADERKTLAVEVTAAVKLTSNEVESFNTALTQKYQREVDLTFKVDPEIIGGALIRAGDSVFDGTVRGKLEKLQSSLTRT